MVSKFFAPEQQVKHQRQNVSYPQNILARIFPLALNAFCYFQLLLMINHWPGIPQQTWGPTHSLLCWTQVQSQNFCMKSISVEHSGMLHNTFDNMRTKFRGLHLSPAIVSTEANNLAAGLPGVFWPTIYTYTLPCRTAVCIFFVFERRQEEKPFPTVMPRNSSSFFGILESNRCCQDYQDYGSQPLHSCWARCWRFWLMEIFGLATTIARYNRYEGFTSARGQVSEVVAAPKDFSRTKINL